MMVDISSLLLRDFSDLTRPELIARAKHLDILRGRVVYTHDMAHTAERRFGSLRSSPLHQMDEADAHYDWHYASYCLAAETRLIYSALSQPARPFSA